MNAGLVDDCKQAAQHPFDHRVLVRPTFFRLPTQSPNLPPPTIQDLYTMLAGDDKRNRQIVQDVLAAVREKRFPVILTERREHMDSFVNLLSPHIQHVFAMAGGMGKKQRRQLRDRMAAVPVFSESERLSAEFTRHIPVRSLDILHVATALTMNYGVFLTGASCCSPGGLASRRAAAEAARTIRLAFSFERQAADPRPRKRLPLLSRVCHPAHPSRAPYHA